MGVQDQLHLRSDGKKIYLPPICHTLSRKEKISFCQCLHNVKVPQGYSLNIKSLVQLKDLKLVGLKFHDCHVLMQKLLIMAIQDILPNKVRHAITRMCFSSMPYVAKSLILSSYMSWKMRLLLSYVSRRRIFLLHFSTSWFT